MLQVNVAIRLEDRARHRVVVLRHAHAFQVRDAHAAVVNNPPPRPRDTDAQIEIVAIHEKIFVEDCSDDRDLRQRAARRQHERAIDRADLVAAVSGQMREIVGGEDRRVRERCRIIAPS